MNLQLSWRKTSFWLLWVCCIAPYCKPINLVARSLHGTWHVLPRWKICTAINCCQLMYTILLPWLLNQEQQTQWTILNNMISKPLIRWTTELQLPNDKQKPCPMTILQRHWKFFPLLPCKQTGHMGGYSKILETIIFFNQVCLVHKVHCSHGRKIPP